MHSGEKEQDLELWKEISREWKGGKKRYWLLNQLYMLIFVASMKGGLIHMATLMEA